MWSSICENNKGKNSFIYREGKLVHIVGIFSHNFVLMMFIPYRKKIIWVFVDCQQKGKRKKVGKNGKGYSVELFAYRRCKINLWWCCYCAGDARVYVSLMVCFCSSFFRSIVHAWIMDSFFRIFWWYHVASACFSWKRLLWGMQSHLDYGQKSQFQILFFYLVGSQILT